jgi:hypothetical protein
MMIQRVKALSKQMRAVDMKASQNCIKNYDESDLIFEGAIGRGENPNLVTSHVRDEPGTHALCIDIDMPAQLYPSKTPGHHHLYIDIKLNWETYKELLQALAKAGIIEEGYAGASIARGCTALRPPSIESEFARLREEIQTTSLLDF